MAKKAVKEDVAKVPDKSEDKGKIEKTEKKSSTPSDHRKVTRSTVRKRATTTDELTVGTTNTSRSARSTIQLKNKYKEYRHLVKGLDKIDYEKIPSSSEVLLDLICRYAAQASPSVPVEMRDKAKALLILHRVFSALDNMPDKSTGVIQNIIMQNKSTEEEWIFSNSYVLRLLDILSEVQSPSVIDDIRSLIKKYL